MRGKYNFVVKIIILTLNLLKEIEKYYFKEYNTLFF